MFPLNPLPILNTMAVSSVDGRRYYTLPDGTSYPSVTTVIGEYLPKEHLKEWKERVGEEEASKITTQASKRGNSVHELCEEYLRGNLTPKILMRAMPINVESFRKIQKELDKYIDEVNAIEYPAYSHKLRTAGRIDNASRWNKRNSIVDFKTSRYLKDESYILGYFLQTTAYSMMIEEMLGLHFPQIVVVIAVDHEPVQIFVKERKDYEEQVISAFVAKRREWEYKLKSMDRLST